ncbi:pyrimidine dimer DNA glycosylase [Mycobacterium sp. CBMA271]|uniref:pyrimidine dimer DNA glycosylase/endonuclease V n=1 Tax=unclassified Mycobacteroides TaxID=2618759 RepID=UPI0012DCD3A6|nr:MULTISPECIES: pyrimidine dimer DNA glycosylase/endonuclease V [unclassified Mycobacteroides]MUM17849.1 pyrimidine dimer DNA glycosylase [Mycobacteroides sp. CBMA 326]MUM20420.1 pyrimidine dimer DNA glycosylase [Mycobacteroides sp. CBMA 271]
MRLWSLHPRNLDAKGLVACWRETLLAQKVLEGRTRGYRNHPQLDRFKEIGQPLDAIGAYLAGLADEADHRGYRFNRELIRVPISARKPLIDVHYGQLTYERWLLDAKLTLRNSAGQMSASPFRLRPHPIFQVIPGEIEVWEKVVPGYP